MLSTSQKSVILSKAGIAVPPFPAGRSLAPWKEKNAHDEQQLAIEAWAEEINVLYVAYVAARAAKSLREAEETDVLARLQRAATGMPP